MHVLIPGGGVIRFTVRRTANGVKMAAVGRIEIHITRSA